MIRTPLPRLIQGGMGVGVSSWPLARAVAQRGHLGVVSGTAVDLVLVRRLQDGDLGGHIRRALEHFPVPAIAQAVVDRYLRTSGRRPGEPYKLLSMMSHRSPASRQDVCVLGAFCEVWLAREEQTGLIGINLMTKVQVPTLGTLYGAMLAGVDVVLMGAGIPREIPGALDQLAAGVQASLTLDVVGVPAATARPQLTLDPVRYGAPTLVRPAFFAIISSHTLATVLARKASGTVEGFVVEAPVAGGHNAPPRGPLTLDAQGEPIYSARDHVDLDALAALGIPFWMAGGMDSPGAVAAALASGATGVQVGTLFAYCRESGIEESLRRRVLEQIRAGTEVVHTDPRASSTGYPFKVVALSGTVSEEAVYRARTRVCDLGYLREAYMKANHTVGYRCAAEPVDVYAGKGGRPADAGGRRCLCNGLSATIGLGQARVGGHTEPAVITSGDGLGSVRAVLGESDDYSAGDVIDYLLGRR